MKEDTLDIKSQCVLAIGCLNSMLPFCEKAGIKTEKLESYDEWELLVRAVFNSFLILPICDTTGLYTPSDFHPLYRKLLPGKVVIVVEHSHGRGFIHNFARSRTGKMAIELNPLDDPNNRHPLEINPDAGVLFYLDKIDQV